MLDTVCFVHLVGLRAGEASCQRSAASRHRGRERGAAVGQEGLQVAAQLLRTLHRCVMRQQKFKLPRSHG